MNLKWKLLPSSCSAAASLLWAARLASVLTLGGQFRLNSYPVFIVAAAAGLLVLLSALDARCVTSQLAAKILLLVLSTVHLAVPYALWHLSTG